VPLRQRLDGDREQPVAFAVIALLQRIDLLAPCCIKRTGEAIHFSRDATGENGFRRALRQHHGVLAPRGRYRQAAATEVEGKLVPARPWRQFEFPSGLQDGLVKRTAHARLEMRIDSGMFEQAVARAAFAVDMHRQRDLRLRQRSRLLDAQ
jgi:hypothetical protein